MYKHFFKRIIDFIIALVALPFFLIIFIPVAIWIVADDGFPVLYNANRIGQNGKLFKMYKFRSMKKMHQISVWQMAQHIMVKMIQELLK